MKYALIVVTNNGAKLAEKLRQNLQSGDIYVKEGRHNLSFFAAEFAKMRDLVADIFYRYDAIVFFTSTGIAVRMIAPYIVHKAKDPAVVVVDEQAHFAVSLLSGHLGGANELTRQIAAILQATPVITTATDANNMIAPDVIAQKLQLAVFPLTHIKIVNAALVAGRNLPYYIEENWQKADEYVNLLRQYNIEAKKITARKLNLSFTPCVFISPQRRVMTNVLTLAPRRLIAGVGCRRGIDKKLIEKAVAQAKKMASCEQLAVKNLVSTIVKKDEAGLIDWAKENKVRTHFFANEIMQKMIEKYNLQQSPFVRNQIGIGNVCEAAILSYNEKAKIILPKTKFEKVTVSLAWE